MSVSIIARSVWCNPGNRSKRIRKLMAAAFWQVRKRVSNRPGIMRLANGARFRAFPDCVISSALHYADWPEHHEIQFCRRQLQKGQVVIDVGANVGHFSLLLADEVGPENVICFEPTPVAWRRLVGNFELNGWPTSRLHHAAVGSTSGMVDFPDTEKPETTNSVVWPASTSRTIQVRLVTLDSLVPDLSDKSVGLLKVDVEGYEPEVFTGANVFLQKVRPRLVMFEFSGDGPAPEVRAVLERHRYILFQLDVSGNPDLSALTAQNLFAAPAENAAALGLTKLQKMDASA